MLRSIIERFSFDRVRRFVMSEYLVLLAMAISSALVFAFIDLADDVLEGDTHETDLAILSWFLVPGDPSRIMGPVWLQEAVRDVTALGSATILTVTVIVVAIALILNREWRGALLIVISTGTGTLLSNTLKRGFGRQRPDFETVYADLANSFPSGHAMLSAVVFLTLGALLSRFVDHWRLRVFIFATAVILTLAVGASRVYLGVHYPSDVVAGWALGAAWAMAWSAIAFFLQRRRMI